MNLTATDRSALIRLASTLPKGSEERKAILAGLKEANKYPQCSGETGLAKVRCLIDATLNDSIPDAMKKKRLHYLKTLNSRFEWGPRGSVYDLVNTAVARVASVVDPKKVRRQLDLTFKFAYDARDTFNDDIVKFATQIVKVLERLDINDPKRANQSLKRVYGILDKASSGASKAADDELHEFVSGMNDTLQDLAAVLHEDPDFNMHGVPRRASWVKDLPTPRGYSWYEEDQAVVLVDRNDEEVGSLANNNGRWLHYTPDDQWPSGRGDDSAEDAAYSLLTELGLN